jgi:hypothetical protein
MSYCIMLLGLFENSISFMFIKLNMACSVRVVIEQCESHIFQNFCMEILDKF